MRLILRTDGGSRGNPGPAAAGVVLSEPNGRTVLGKGFYLGRTTNNVAEYQGLLHGLDEAARLGATELDVFCDSELIVKQVNGHYRVKNAGLKPLHQEVAERIRDFARVKVQHVYRSDNAEADDLVNRALDAQADVDHAAGESDSSTDEKVTPNAGDITVGATVNLREHIEFKSDGAVRKLLCEMDRVRTEMLCLRDQQRCAVTIEAGPATVTIMRGRGTFKAGSRDNAVYAGQWLQFPGPGQISFAADAGEDMVVIVSTRR